MNRHSGEIITVPEMARRMKIRKQAAYDMVEEPGFPIYNIGGARGKRVLWPEPLEWLRENKSGAI
ncbi:hypothetical protein [Paenibacillus polymyxa]|uniref:Helix-turn-helix domain-containing protein n=1 Tax=Paenibacillus polymyxa TaxID=1406 RepID=A0ABX2Z7T7_PAEPO|nr:hypothetical protein [Paenibacillus polymyxa]ODA07327.1 hypothetical protein A7312_09540 [Paenibacillus polymyxa]URJ47419.1 hypothetical protein MF628_002053 [Paenibacillus polymyxa]